MSDNTNLLLLQLKLQKKEDDCFLVTLLHTCRHLQTDIDFTPNKKNSLNILRILIKNNTFVTDLQKMSLFPLFENKAILW